MRRSLLPIVILLVAGACSGDSTDPADTYFQDAATITATYETAAQAHFDDYLAALDTATAETGDAVFVDANRGLFAGLAAEFGPAVEALDALTPPESADDLHESWMSASRALNDVFQSADADLSALDVAEQVNDVVSNLPLADLQAAYRDACSAVAAATPDAVIVCEPQSGS